MLGCWKPLENKFIDKFVWQAICLNIFKILKNNKPSLKREIIKQLKDAISRLSLTTYKDAVDEFYVPELGALYLHNLIHIWILDGFHDYNSVWNFCGHVIENDKIYNAANSTLKNDK